MKTAGAIVALSVLALAGCATAPAPAPACPTGQNYLQTAQLFFGRNGPGQPRINEIDFKKFVDEQLTPRFPGGLTVMDGGGQWRGKDEVLIREASKVVLIVLPKGRDSGGQIEAVRSAYKGRFHQESVLAITQGSCVPL